MQIQEKIISEIKNPNGTINKVMTSTHINKLFSIMIGIGVLIFGFLAAFADNDSPLEKCQQSYIKATNEIVEYNNSNPEYKIELPEYNCSEVALKLTNIGTASGAIVPPPERTLRDRFGLSDCRFINDFHRLGKYNLEWMAYDIACEMGKSFDVKSPGEYTIQVVAYGANLGNYLILKKSSEVGDDETRIVLGHIKTSRKVGDKLSEGDIIGQTDVSGASTNYHVHIELWSGYMNVSREFALSKNYKALNGTALLNHRHWNFRQPSEVYYFTAYDLGDVKQNDSTPCIGASGKDLCQLESRGIRTMALTSDIRQSLGIKFGEKVRLEGDAGCEGVFQVEDEMNKRFRETPGILRPGTPYYIKGDLPSKEGGVCSITKL